MFISICGVVFLRYHNATCIIMNYRKYVIESPFTREGAFIYYKANGVNREGCSS